MLHCMNASASGIICQVRFDQTIGLASIMNCCSKAVSAGDNNTNLCGSDDLQCTADVKSKYPLE